jgi:hypothetical protein
VSTPSPTPCGRKWQLDSSKCQKIRTMQS